MPDHEVAAAGPQIRLRGLFVILTLAAIAVAAAAPFLRQWTANQWQQLAIAMGCFCAGFGLMNVLWISTRERRHRYPWKQIGSPQIRLRNPQYFPKLSPMQLLFLAAAAVYVFPSLFILHNFEKLNLALYLLFLNAGLRVFFGIVQFADKRATAGPLGVVMRSQFHSWWSIAVAADGDRIRLAGPSFEVVGQASPEEIAQILEWRYGK